MQENAVKMEDLERLSEKSERVSKGRRKWAWEWAPRIGFHLF